MSAVANPVPEDFLTDDLLKLVRWIAAQYFLPGGDHDDLVQEGMIGAFKAVRDYDPTVGMNFNSFARLCIERNVITAVKTATRQKHQTLTHAQRVVASNNESIADDDAFDVIPDPRDGDPLTVLIQREQLAELAGGIMRLSPLERAATLRFAGGESYSDMADLGDTKRVDNALQRARLYLTGKTNVFKDTSDENLRGLTKTKARLPWE